jgi:hypothetical protein
MNYAKQSTAKSFLVGPILDANGVAKTDEVVGSIKVTKNGSVGAPNGASTLTHNHTGHYVYAANAGDLDTLGEAAFSLNSGTNAMAPVRFVVLPANVYDALVSGSDYLDISLVQWLGSAPAALADTDKLQASVQHDALSLATAAKLLAYVQLLARKDPLIAIDKATELGEINTDEGSGAGGYLNTQDAQEAMRDALTNMFTPLDLHLTDIKGSGFVADTDSLVNLFHTGADGDTGETLSDQLDGIPTTGSGSVSWTINVAVGGNPIDGAEVKITSDAAGTTAVAGPKYTDASGDVDFLLDPGTYYGWVQSAGYNFSNPTTVTVTA